MLVAAPDRRRQDRRRRVRRPPGAARGPQVLLHDADQGAVEPEVRRPRRPARRRPGRPAHRRQRGQRRRRRRRHDHRGAAQHAVRRGASAAATACAGCAHVVMDEVHYLADRERGAVWEEVIIHLPGRRAGHLAVGDGEQRRGVRRVAGTVRGDTEVVVEEHRPVPLWQHVLVGTPAVRPVRAARGTTVNPRARAARPRRGAPAGPRPRRARRAGGARRPARSSSRPGRARPARQPGAAAGDHLHLQPGRLRRRRRAVRARRAAAQHRRGGRARSARYVERAHRATCRARTCGCSATGSGWRACSAASPPTTPACCRPSRRSSRSCSPQGLVKAVFATETLALGINMPARSVVLEKLVEVERRDARRRDAGGVHPAHRPRRPPRHRRRGPRRRAVAAGHGPAAGRRARLDPHLPAAVELPAVLQHGRQPGRRARPRAGPDAAGELVRAVPGRRLGGRAGPAGHAATSRALEGYARGDDLPPRRRAGVRPAARRAQAARGRPGPQRRGRSAGPRPPPSLEQLKPGDVVARADRPPRRAWPSCSTRASARNGERPPAGAHRGPLGRAGCRSADFPAAVEPVGRRARPQGLQPPLAAGPARPRLGAARARTCPARGRGAPRARPPPTTTSSAALRAALRRHPVHGCEDREAHMRWAERWHRLRGETDALERRVAGKTSLDRPHLRPGLRGARRARLPRRRRRSPTAGRVAGAGLQRVRPARRREPARAGCGTRCRPAELAAVVVVARLREPPRRRVQPASCRPAPVQTALTEMDRLWARLRRARVATRACSSCASPTPASPGRPGGGPAGARLEQVLDDDPDMTAGDFVRWCKQLVDLLGQIAARRRGPLAGRRGAAAHHPQGHRRRPPRCRRLQQSVG